MIGFNFKSLVLQLIHGSIVIIPIIYINWSIFDRYLIHIEANGNIVLTFMLLLFFSIGVLIDFLADMLESLAVKCLRILPIYPLLKEGNQCGITLAHNKYILNELCEIAAKCNKSTKNAQYYLAWFEKRNREIVNYILQVAKNKAFRVCQDSQREQTDSFFILYVFSRNLSLSLLISASIMVSYDLNVSIILLLVMILTLLASYRYYLYYLRILLGSTIDNKMPLHRKNFAPK